MRTCLITELEVFAKRREMLFVINPENSARKGSKMPYRACFGKIGNKMSLVDWSFVMAFSSKNGNIAS